MTKIQNSLGLPFKDFLKTLVSEAHEDEIFNGAATLAYYWMLAIFPAMIFLLSLLPYLPVENLDQVIMGFVRDALPKQTVPLFSSVVADVTANKNTSLLSFGALATIWAASSGMYAIMKQLNKTYNVKERRSYLKARMIAIFMTFVFGLIIVGAFSLIVFGTYLHGFLAQALGDESSWVTFYGFFRWAVTGALLLLGLAWIYYFGPDVEQKFRFVTPGSLFGAVMLIVSSLVFQYYVSNFKNFAATYGSIGAVIILMLWFYISGLVILLGSEVNALIEHSRADGKNKGEHRLNERRSVAQPTKPISVT